jgi:hypothetical protein
MTHPENEFGDFEADFQKTPKAAAGASVGSVPEGAYKVVLSKQDIAGDGKAVDYEIFKANSGTTGFKIFLEIVSPEVVVNKTTNEKVKTKGEIIEHVFWITQKNLGYLKRDLSTILGKEITSLNELKTTTWVGRTCEVGVKNEVYRGFNQSRVNFFNAWNGKDAGGKSAAPADGGKQAQPANTQAPGAGEDPAF